MADAYDHKEKFLLVGRPGSGKSSIVTKFSEDVFRSEYISTIGEFVYLCVDYSQPFFVTIEIFIVCCTTTIARVPTDHDLHIAKTTFCLHHLGTM